MRPVNLFFFLPVSRYTIMHCRHRNKEIVTASANVLNNNASKSKIMTNESKIHIDQIKSIKDTA